MEQRKKRPPGKMLGFWTSNSTFLDGVPCIPGRAAADWGTALGVEQVCDLELPGQFECGGIPKHETNASSESGYSSRIISDQCLLRLSALWVHNAV